MNRNDVLWKGILEDTLEDFLRFLIQDADRVFDLSKKIEFLDKELNQLFRWTSKTANRRSDMSTKR